MPRGSMVEMRDLPDSCQLQTEADPPGDVLGEGLENFNDRSPGNVRLEAGEAC